MAWRVARSLDTLLAQWNAAAPRRSKVSDGSIGDAAHASRTSDHNPWVKDGAVGVVTARDYTHDPKNGADCEKLAQALVRSKDPRIKYIIWNRRIWTPGAGWSGYRGTNPHDKHLHLSVESTKNLYDDARPWAISTTPRPAQPAQPKEEDDMFSEWDRAMLTDTCQRVQSISYPWVPDRKFLPADSFRVEDIHKATMETRAMVEELAKVVAELARRSGA